MDGLWDSDEVNIVASHLSPRDLGAFAGCCRTVQSNLRSRATLRWLSELRGLDQSSAQIASIEHIEIAEVMAEVSSTIAFGWGSMDLDPACLPSLRRVARLLHKHPTLSLSIEAHCGLEARWHMPLAGQAQMYTRRRAEVVRDALMSEAAESGYSIDGARARTRAWGCSRPLVWAFNEGYDDRHCDPEASARNRRVELFLRSGALEVTPLHPTASWHRP